MRRRSNGAITACDYALLEQLLAAKPEVVLSYFTMAQITCLAQLESYQRLCRHRPQAAARVAFVAATLGIPIDP